MIALLSESFPPVIGGAETMSSRLARAWHEAGRDLVVFADARGIAGEADADKKQPFPVRRFDGPRPFRRWRKFRAVAEHAAKRPDTVVVADSWRSVPPALPPDFPVLCLAHGNDMLAIRPKKEVRRKRALDRTAILVANSEFTAELARGVLPASVQVRVVHSGADPAEPPDEKKDAFNRRQVVKQTNKADPLLITCARLEPRKGMDSVIQALPALKAAHPNIGYLVIGEGPDKEKERLEKLARECGVADRVFGFKPLSAPKRFAALACSALFVMPCRHSEHSVEGFGIPFLEAARCGIPAVAAQLGGAPEAVADGKTGWLCNGEDPEKVAAVLKRALADKSELAKRGQAAKKRADDFTWQSAAQQILALADEAIRAKK